MSQRYRVEAVFKTEGVPIYTFVEPPNYTEILVDVRHPSKPVIIEGQSGTGKTVTIKKILTSVNGKSFQYLSPRKPNGLEEIQAVLKKPKKDTYVIDDFHRIPVEIQKAFAELVKYAADMEPQDIIYKFIIIGINKVGNKLINFSPDLAKRISIHQIKPGTEEAIQKLISAGEACLNITFSNKKLIFKETQGDYWLTQQFCKTACVINGIDTKLDEHRQIKIHVEKVRESIAHKLHEVYIGYVKDFCKGNRFRPGNDPYFKLLRAFAEQTESSVSVEDLSASNPELLGCINNIKETRLSTLLETKTKCGEVFFYNSQNKFFAVEDPALFFYLKNIDWEHLRVECGFRKQKSFHIWDIAISFAGEQRLLAKSLADSLEALDITVFYDEHYEQNLFGKSLEDVFRKIFSEEAHYIVCIIDKNYSVKIWTRFEKQAFSHKIEQGHVIPIFIDDTPILGISNVIKGFPLQNQKISENNVNTIADEIALKLENKLKEEL